MSKYEEKQNNTKFDKNNSLKWNMLSDYIPSVILLTGGAGFIGSHFLTYLVETYPHYKIICLDKLNYCSNIKNFQECELYRNFTFIKGDICSSDLINFILQHECVDTIIHFAAQTHVDNSFDNSINFTQTNVVGTHILLEAARQYNEAISNQKNRQIAPFTSSANNNSNSLISNKNQNFKMKKSLGIRRFIHVSTDEVYGEAILDAPNGMHQHSSVLNPTNPYAATKVAAEYLVKSYFHSFHFPIIITRGNNVYGPRQFPEKLIPKFISLLQRNQKLTLHGTGENKRSYLYINDVVEAFDLILHRGENGEIYNIGSDKELTNKQVAGYIINYYNQILNNAIQNHKHDNKNSSKTNQISLENYIEYVSDRPYNDLRYFIDTTSLNKLGWKQKISFEQGLKLTCQWYMANTDYWADEIESVLTAHPYKSTHQELFLVQTG